MEVHVICRNCGWNEWADVNKRVIDRGGIVANGELFKKVKDHHFDLQHRTMWGGHRDYTLFASDGRVIEFTANSYCLDFP